MGLKLGSKAKDRITGFTGAVTGKAEYITGCAQYLVQPPLNKEGAFVEPRWIDVDRLELLPEEPATVQQTRPGPDLSAPIK